MHYYIDGYNFLFRLSKNWHLDLRTQREALIKIFNEKIEELSLSLTIVFDGADAPRGDYTRGHWKNVEVVYTHEGLSADEYILQHLENIHHPELHTVVTNDRELMGRAKLLGSLGMDTGAFISLLEHRERKKIQRKRVQRVVSDTKDNIARLEKIFKERLEKEEDY